MKILTIGGITLDTFIHNIPMPHRSQKEATGLQEYIVLPYGAKVEVTSLARAFGGGALNSALTFQQANCKVSIASRIGQDPIAKEIIAWLQHRSIDIQHISSSYTQATAQSFVLPCPNGDRIIFAYPGATQELSLTKINNSLYEGIYCSGISAGAAAQLPLFLQQAKGQGSRIALNPGMKQLQEPQCLLQALQSAEILILNAYESSILAQYLTLEQWPIPTNAPTLFTNFVQQKGNMFGIISYMRAALQLGPSIIIVTNGNQGIYIGTQETVYYHPSLSATVVNTIGAGDAFGSAFSIAYWQQANIEEALKIALINSRDVIQVEDANSGIMAYKNLLDEARQLTHDTWQVALR